MYLQIKRFYFYRLCQEKRFLVASTHILKTQCRRFRPNCHSGYRFLSQTFFQGRHWWTNFFKRHFQATDRKKFNDIWKMNEEQIKDLVSDVLAEDRIIFEQQLGMEWDPPNL